MSRSFWFVEESLSVAYWVLWWVPVLIFEDSVLCGRAYSYEIAVTSSQVFMPP